MNANDFTYWLQGFFELTDTNNLTENQVKIIKEHLKLVFTKKTSNISPKGDWVDLSRELEKYYEEFKNKNSVKITYPGLEQTTTICTNPENINVINQPEKDICINNEKYCSSKHNTSNISNKDNKADFEKIVSLVEDALKTAESGKMRPISTYCNDSLNNITTHTTC